MYIIKKKNEINNSNMEYICADKIRNLYKLKKKYNLCKREKSFKSI